LTQVRSKFATWIERGILIAPAFVLLAAALPRMATGIRLETTFPVPAFIATDRTLPQTAYRDTADILASAAAADGESRIAGARAAYLAGDGGPALASRVDGGLAHAPASASGWVLRALLRQTQNPKSAADALGVSYQIAPHDYFLSPMRARAAARLWNSLPADTQTAAKTEIVDMWNNKAMRPKLADVLNTPNGAAPVTAAMADNPEALKALNRMATRLKYGLRNGN
jgi:hypothetical protein